MLFSALLIGLAGGWHCGAMCAPLQTAVLGKQSFTSSLWIFHSGRISSYVVIGILLYLFGEGMDLLGLQNYFLYLLCAFLLYQYIVPQKWKSNTLFKSIESFPYHFLKRVLPQTHKNSPLLNKYSMGILNGFLPCGLVYMAAANAVLASNLGLSILCMVVFGAMTMPWLLSSTIVLHKINRLIPKFSFNYRPILALGLIVILLMRVMHEPTQKEHGLNNQSLYPKDIPLCGPSL